MSQITGGEFPPLLFTLPSELPHADYRTPGKTTPLSGMRGESSLSQHTRRSLTPPGSVHTENTPPRPPPIMRLQDALMAGESGLGFWGGVFRGWARGGGGGGAGRCVAAPIGLRCFLGFWRPPAAAPSAPAEGWRSPAPSARARPCTPAKGAAVLVCRQQRLERPKCLASRGLAARRCAAHHQLPPRHTPCTTQRPRDRARRPPPPPPPARRRRPAAARG